MMIGMAGDHRRVEDAHYRVIRTEFTGYGREPEEPGAPEPPFSGYPHRRV